MVNILRDSQMSISRFYLTTLIAVISLNLSSCASMDKDVTKFEPLRTDTNAQYYKFTAFADVAYPIDSKEAEQARIKWLEKWLLDNGLGSRNYEICSRVPVLRNKALLGDVYDIFYEVKITK